MKLLNTQFLMRKVTVSWIDETAIQYKLNAHGKVTQIGSVRIGMNTIYFLIFLIVVPMFPV